MPDLIRAWARRSFSALAIVYAAAAVSSASAESTLFSFRAPLGAAPVALVQAGDGRWYGATRDGGDHGHGVLFVLGARGVPRPIYAFRGAADGGSPSALVATGAGTLYGFCALPSGLGLFRATTGGELRVIHTLPTPSGTPLLAAGGGHVYGTDGAGSIFEVVPAGQPRAVYTLAAGGSVTALTLGRDGALYGTSPPNAAAPAALFRVTPDGQYSVLANLAAASDTSPAEAPTALARDPSGALFVAARHGDSAAIYRFDAEQGLRPLAALDAAATQLAVGPRAELYALTTSGAGRLLRIAADGGAVTLHDFGANGGAAPASLALGAGALYGAALEGGAGFGTLYRYTAATGFSTLHSFSYPDGVAPGALIRSGDAFYGTTERGGAHGFGTIFKADATGNIETVHAFSGDDGSAPQSLTLGKDGVIYGRTRQGGSGGQGTLFALPPNAALETWVAFDQPGQGEGPALVQTSDGTLYGADHAASGHLFRVRMDHSYEVVFSFPGLAERDGAAPSALVVGPDGALYGATRGAFGPMIPPNYSSGTLFRLDAAGSFSTLYAFNEGDRALGASPSGLVVGADGALYGTSSNIAFLCGSYGSLFKLDPKTNQTELVYAFTGKDDGTGPNSLIQASSGVFYGLTLGGMGLVGAGENAGECKLRNSTVFAYADGALETLATLPYALSQTEAAADASHVAALAYGADGGVYGVAADGGSAGSGELFVFEP